MMEGPVLFQGVQKDSKAFKLMQQMGWEEGTGLGKDGQGIKQHLRVKKKNDCSGLGVDEKEKAARDWTFNTTAFDNILKNLKVQVAGSDSKEDQAGNLEESREDNAPTLRAKKLTRPQGRYKRREACKDVKGYSTKDLQAILGKSDVESEKPYVEVVLQPPQSLIRMEIESNQSSEDEALMGLKPVKKEFDLKPVKEEFDLKPVKEEFDLKPVKEELDLKPVKQALSVVDRLVKQELPRQRNFSTVPLASVKQEKMDSKVRALEHRIGYLEVVNAKPEAASASVEVVPLPQDWWGNKFGFVRAGDLGSQQPQTKTGENGSERTAFREQDQENLYNLVQDKATTGKQGLGIGDRSHKIGGVRFKGKKTTFNNEEEADAGRCSEDRDAKEPTASVVCCPTGKRKQDEMNSDLGAETPGRTLKWKKLCRGILKEAPEQTMSLKRLQKRVTEATGLPPDSELRNKLDRSSQFRIEGKKVSLSSGRDTPQL